MTAQGDRADGLRRTSADDRGSLSFAIMAILVGLMLGGLMLPMIISQSRSSRFDITRVHALHAAQSGIDVVLGEIRASTTTNSDGNTLGRDGGLPCWSQSNPLTGNANATGTGKYSVYVTYFANDPGSNSQMTCTDGYGPYSTDLHTATPRYAMISSTGTDTSAPNGAAVAGSSNSNGRTLVATYVLQTDDTNIPGGLIVLYPNNSGTRMCMDAGSAVPSPGTQLVLHPCSSSSPPLAQQVFAYRSDLSIQLLSSVTTQSDGTSTTGLCIDTSPTTPRTHAAGAAVVLNACAVANPAKCANITACSPWYQQWSVNDNAHLEGAKSDQSTTDGYCINAVQADNNPLTLAGCAGSTSDTAQTWIPSSTSGAGMAGAGNSQLVNYLRFGTCLDVTGQNPNATYLILYTCKQNPNPTAVTWNQKFAPAPALGAAPATVLLKTTASGTTYCLTSPLASGGYVRVTSPCPAGASASTAYSWTMSQAQDASGNDLPYAQKYTIVDSSGYCLGLGANNDQYLGQYLKAIVTKCDGSTGQKWNANSSLDAARLTNTHEH